MIRVKRKSLKILKFSSRQSVITAPVNAATADSRVTNIIMNFVIDPIFALQSGADQVEISVVRNKYLRPSVLDDYTENGSAASKIRTFSQINEEANQAYRNETIYRSFVSINDLIESNMPDILGVDLNDPRAIRQAYPKKQVLLTKKALNPRDLKKAVSVPRSTNFVFPGQAQLFNATNSSALLSPDPSKLRVIAQSDLSLAAGVFVSNCSKFPFPLQEVHRNNRDRRVSQYGEYTLEQQAKFLESINDTLKAEPVQLNADKALTKNASIDISLNTVDAGSDLDVYNEFSGISSTSETLFLIEKRIKKFEFGVAFGLLSPSDLKNFIVIAKVKNSNGVTLQTIEKDVDAEKMIRSVTNPLFQPSISASSAATDDSGNFSVSCIVERKDPLNDKVLILVQEPGGKFEKFSTLTLNLGEPFEFTLTPEASSGFLRIRAITVSASSRTSQEFSDIAIEIGRTFEIIDSPSLEQSALNKISTVNLRKVVTSTDDGKYRVAIDSIPPGFRRRVAKLAFDQLSMRRINLSNGENPGDVTSGTKVSGKGTKFEGLVRDSYFDTVDAGSYVYVFDGINSTNGTMKAGIASIPVSISENFASFPDRKSGSDGTMIASEAIVTLRNDGVSGSISIRPETDNIEVKKNELGIVLEGSTDFSRKAEINIEPYITDILTKEDGTLVVSFEVPKEEIPQELIENDKFIPLTSAPSFEYEKQESKGSEVSKATIVTDFGEVR